MHDLSPTSGRHPGSGRQPGYELPRAAGSGWASRCAERRRRTRSEACGRVPWRQPDDDWWRADLGADAARKPGAGRRGPPAETARDTRAAIISLSDYRFASNSSAPAVRPNGCTFDTSTNSSSPPDPSSGKPSVVVVGNQESRAARIRRRLGVGVVSGCSKRRFHNRADLEFRSRVRNLHQLAVPTLKKGERSGYKDDEPIGSE
jgi:hypothetical protein